MRKVLTHAAAVGFESSSPWLDKVSRYWTEEKLINENQHSLSNQHKSRHTIVSLLFPRAAKFDYSPILNYKFGAKLYHLGHDSKS